MFSTFELERARAPRDQAGGTTRQRATAQPRTRSAIRSRNRSRTRNALGRILMQVRTALRVGVACGMLGVTLVGFSLSHKLWLSLFLVVPLGAATMIQISATNTLIQIATPDALRGRDVSRTPTSSQRRRSSNPRAR